LVLLVHQSNSSNAEAILQVECRFIQRDFLDACESQVHCFKDYLVLRAARDVKIGMYLFIPSMQEN
jgi:hypothetical protein